VKVAFVVNDLQLSGGIGVVVEHAHQLASRQGIEATLVLARDQVVPEWSHRGLPDLPVMGMRAARADSFDVAVSTWWETTWPLFELRAERHAYFVQSLEERFYLPHQPERFAAAMTHDLPLAILTEARWIADTLQALRPQLRVRLVRNGIAKDVFAGPPEPTPSVDGPLRILVEGSAQVWFKGVADALEAAAGMRLPHHVTLVTPDGAPPRGTRADRVVGPVPHAEMAGLYAQTDVVLKLSRVEGMYGPPLEGFHMGATCVTTPVTGHEEYVEHGWNGLVVDWDDPRGTARALDLLARDRMLLHFLRHNALHTAHAWPSWEQQGAVMAAALHDILRSPQPPASEAMPALLADVRASMQAHAGLADRYGRLRYRAAPVLALDRALEEPAMRWAAGPLRSAWGAVRRRLG
jgi:glycosyltransferase involved in cell wall biosynthesis